MNSTIAQAYCLEFPGCASRRGNPVRAWEIPESWRYGVRVWRDGGGWQSQEKILERKELLRERNWRWYPMRIQLTNDRSESKLEGTGWRPWRDGRLWTRHKVVANHPVNAGRVSMTFRMLLAFQSVLRLLFSYGASKVAFLLKIKAWSVHA